MIVLIKLLPCPTKFIAVDMVPGPASKGMPNGDIAMSSYGADESTTFDLCAAADFPLSRSYPIKKTIIPPATWKAGSVILNNLNMICPKRQNIAIIINAVTTALYATLLIILLSASPTMVKNTGVLPIGFNMAKKPKKTVDKNRVRFGIEFMMSDYTSKDKV